MKRVIGALLLFLTLALLASCHVSHPEAEADFQEPEVSPPAVVITPTPITTPEPVEPEPEFVPIWTEEEVSYLTKAVYGEAGGIPSLTEQSAVVWCILNWCDRDGESIIYEVTYPHRFQGYRASNPEPEHLRELVIDVLTRWQRESRAKPMWGEHFPPITISSMEMVRTTISEPSGNNPMKYGTGRCRVPTKVEVEL